MTELETLLMKFVGRLLYMQLEMTGQQTTQEILQKRQKYVSALVEELVSKFYWLYKFKDKDTQEIIRQQARLLHDNDVETVVGDVATIALHHLLFNTPDGYMTTQDKCEKLRVFAKFKKVSEATLDNTYVGQDGVKYKPDDF